MATDKAGATIKYTKPWLQTSLETAVLWSINQIYKVYYHCDMTKVTCVVNIIENFASHTIEISARLDREKYQWFDPEQSSFPHRNKEFFDAVCYCLHINAMQIVSGIS